MKKQNTIVGVIVFALLFFSVWYFGVQKTGNNYPHEPYVLNSVGYEWKCYASEGSLASGSYQQKDGTSDERGRTMNYAVSPSSTGFSMNIGGGGGRLSNWGISSYMQCVPTDLNLDEVERIVIGLSGSASLGGKAVSSPPSAYVTIAGLRYEVSGASDRYLQTTVREVDIEIKKTAAGNWIAVDSAGKQTFIDNVYLEIGLSGGEYRGGMSGAINVNSLTVTKKSMPAEPANPEGQDVINLPPETGTSTWLVLGGILLVVLGGGYALYRAYRKK